MGHQRPGPYRNQELPVEELASALLLATTVKVFLDYVATVIHRRLPEVDLWFFDFIALAIGGVLAWFANVDVFAEFLPAAPAWETRLLTAVVIGGGATLINSIFGKQSDGGVTSRGFGDYYETIGPRRSGW